MSITTKASLLALLAALAAQGAHAQDANAQNTSAQNAAAPAATAPAAAAPASAAASGLYSADQAQQGEILFNNNCAQCHRPDLTGALGPALKGPAFLARWGGKPVSDLYQFEHSQMPANNPGTLSDDEMIPITAFILSKNGVPAGQTPLSKDSMTGILPKPAATN